MVQRTLYGNRLFWRALTASVALHLLVALLLPVWTAQVSGGLQPIETVSFAQLVRVQIQRPAPKSLPAAPAQTHHRAPVVSFARTRTELTAPRSRLHPRPSPQHGPTGRVAAAPKYVAVRSAPLYARPTASASVSAQQAPAAPSPQPETTQAPREVAGTGSSDRGGVLPFTAAQDPVLDPGVRAQLQQRFAVHVTLIVTVGEDGRTKRVEFEPPIDPHVERQIEALLADANWDAAVCGGGVSCEGTATIKL